MKRIVFVGGAALLLAAMGAGSASADAKFDKTSVPSNTDVNLVLNASVQSLVGYNEKVVLTIPDGFTPLSCSAPQGFKCSKSSATNPTRTLITWENTSPVPAEFGVTPTTQFPFKMHTIATSGQYKFNVDQTYSDGSSDHWTGATGTTNPAPILKVEGIDASPATTIPAGGTDDTTVTTAPSFDTPSYDPSTYTTVPFTDDTTVTTVAGNDTTATTVDETTDTTLGSVAISKSGSGGPGIRGAEKVILLGLVVLAVGAAAFGSWRNRNA